MNFELDHRADHQKQQDAHQRRIWVRMVLLRLILHDRPKMRGISYAGGLWADATKMKGAA
jgi:hypothetical protein